MAYWHDWVHITLIDHDVCWPWPLPAEPGTHSIDDKIQPTRTMHELYSPYTKSGASLYLGQVWIAVTLRWGKFVSLGQVCKCGESSVLQTKCSSTAPSLIDHVLTVQPDHCYIFFPLKNTFKNYFINYHNIIPLSLVRRTRQTLKTKPLIMLSIDWKIWENTLTQQP